ncbi:MAG: winged helix-turn-helix transcriptional regulator [Clostridia bacterium]|nr:winged helix-turn-helix transcriptional regulator [Clostridia bacterium]
MKTVTEHNFGTLKRMAGFFKVLADETRLKILFSLFDGAKCVMHISERVEMSQSAVSHQLAILKNADLVKVARNGKNQVYSISDEHVRLVVDMAEIHVNEHKDV